MPEDNLSLRAFLILLAIVEVINICNDKGLVLKEEEGEETMEDWGVCGDWGCRLLDWRYSCGCDDEKPTKLYRSCSSTSLTFQP